MSKCTIVVENEVQARIGGLRPEQLGVLYEKFGIFVDGYRFMPAYQMRRWDGKQRFFSDQGKTYTKLLDEIIPYLTAWNLDIEFEDHRPPAPIVTTRITADVFGLPDFQFREYQVEVVNKLLDASSGFGICATGSGKTSMCAAISYVLYLHGIQTIVIVPSTDLVNQTADEFKLRFRKMPNVTVGTYSGSNKEIDHPIVVATWQSLQNNPQHMLGFQGLIVDESHGVKAEVIRNLINEHGKHIFYRYGCTGTFPKSDVDRYALKTSIGQVVAEVPAAWLIEQGYLSSIAIHTYETQDLDNELPDYASEKSWLSKNEGRLAVIAKLIIQKRDEHGNTMALVNSIAQGQALQELIPGSIFLWGEIDTDDRKAEYSKYAEQDGLIIIASFGIASTGISIDRIFAMVLIDSGKSFTKCIQSVGRGLRKKGDKSHVDVYDVFSKLKFSKKHYKNRKEYYNEAQYPISTARPIKLKYDEITKGGLLEL